MLVLPQLHNDVHMYVTSKRAVEVKRRAHAFKLYDSYLLTLLVSQRELSGRTVERFVRLLHLVVESEGLIENLREFIQQNNLRVEELYREFNSDRNGRLTIAEMEIALQRCNNTWNVEALSARQVVLLFYRICSNRSTTLLLDVFE